MPRPPSFPFFPHLAVITLSLCGWLAGGGVAVAAGTYRASAHGGSNGVPAAGQGVVRTGTVLQGPYAAGNCAHCHEQHASIGGSEPVPVKIPTGPSRYLLLADLAGNAACNYCHDSSSRNGADNIASQIAKAFRHDPYSAKVTAPATLWCNDCHDSHEAQKVNHDDPPFTPSNAVAANSPLLSVAEVSVGSGLVRASPHQEPRFWRSGSR